MKTLTIPTTKATDLGFVQCRTCLFDASIAKILPDGECEYCKLQEQQRNQAREPWNEVLKRIKKKGKGRKYDCLIGISGGEDSSVLLYLAVKVWGLRVLALHINNRTNRPEATNNIQLLRDKLDLNFIEYFTCKSEYDDLTDSLLKAGVPDADLANDVIMARLTYQFAFDNGIKTTINGHSYREEGSSPKAWSFLDTTYLRDIYFKYAGKQLYWYDTLGLWHQVKASLLRMDRVSPYHYDTHNRGHVLTTLKSWGWQDYGGKHLENIYTKFVGCYLLPKKFGIDKRRTYLSAAIREGKMTKEYAKEILSKPMEFDLDELGDRKDHILHLVNSSPIQPRSKFKQTNYKRLRPLFWVLVKLGVTPYSVYAKYCK